MRLVGVAVALFAAINCSAADLPKTNAENVGLSSRRLSFIDKFYAERVSQGELAGIVILVSRHGQVAHFSAIGYADRAKRLKLTKDSIFRIYSMTKPIAATALMMLYEEGCFQLDEPISKYIPEFAGIRVLRTPDSPITDTVAAVREPTIRDLFRHTAGLTHGGVGPIKNPLDLAYIGADLFGTDISLAELLRRLAKLPLRHQPGTKWEYGIGQDVQARMVEIFSGMSFDEFLKKRLFGPLGMKDTGFRVNPENASRLAAIHWLKDGNLVPADEFHGYPKAVHPLLESANINSYTTDPSRKGGSYGLVATAEDYWRFAQMLLNRGRSMDGERLLSPSTIRYMTVDHLGSIEVVDNPALRKVMQGRGFGLGFAIVKDQVTAGLASREGTFYWPGAAATYFWVDPSEDIVVVAMTQHMANPKLGPLMEQLQALVYSAVVN